MGKITISTLARMKGEGKKFTCITAYDATFARIISEVGAEAILVGDSLGMVAIGYRQSDVIKKLIEYGAPIAQADAEGNTPLHHAVMESF